MNVVERMKPLDAIALRKLTPTDGFTQLAQLQLDHPQAVGMEPHEWVGAWDSDRLVAAVGWIDDKPGMRMVVEVQRTDDHWGKVGVIVLIRAIIAYCQRSNIRLQAMILPSNAKLKEALAREGAFCAVEIWEAPLCQ